MATKHPIHFTDSKTKKKKKWFRNNRGMSKNSVGNEFSVVYLRVWGFREQNELRQQRCFRRYWRGRSRERQGADDREYQAPDHASSLWTADNHSEFPLGSSEEMHSCDLCVITAKGWVLCITCLVSELAWPIKRVTCRVIYQLKCAWSETWLKPAEPMTSPQTSHYRKGKLCEVRKQN